MQNRQTQLYSECPFFILSSAGIYINTKKFIIIIIFILTQTLANCASVFATTLYSKETEDLRDMC